MAEVLITLGVIGVVAAVTMPTLIQHHRKSVVETKLKKIYTIMNQAINQSVSEYGDASEWDMDCGRSSSPTCTIDEAKEKFNKYIGKHLNIVKIENSEPIENNENAFHVSFNVYLSDGTILCVSNYLYDIYFYLDKRAISNFQLGVNTFEFRFNSVAIASLSEDVMKYNKKGTFDPYTFSWNGTREELLDGNGNRYSCANNGSFCTKLIQYEGWKIPDDYPKKF